MSSVPFFFFLFNVTPRKLAATSVAHFLAHVVFLSDIVALEGCCRARVWVFRESTVKKESGKLGILMIHEEEAHPFLGRVKAFPVTQR